MLQKYIGFLTAIPDFSYFSTSLIFILHCQLWRFITCFSEVILITVSYLHHLLPPHSVYL